MNYEADPFPYSNKDADDILSSINVEKHCQGTIFDAMIEFDIDIMAGLRNSRHFGMFHVFVKG